MANATFEEHPTDPDKMILRKPFPVQFIESEYERGFIDGMQKQMQSSVDKAVNAMSRKWIGLTDDEIDQGLLRSNYALQTASAWRDGVEWATKQLMERNT